MNDNYNIDRKTASRLLNVSLRTVDRYLSSGKLSHKKISGRVWLSKVEIINLYKELQEAENDTRTDTLWQDDTLDTDTDKVLYGETRNKEEAQPIKENTETDTVIYKNLYIETKAKFEQATFRIGQLESELANMVPLLEFQKQQKQLQETNQSYTRRIQEIEYKGKVQSSHLLSKIEEKENILKEKDKEVEIERLNKSIIAVILFVILFLQPVFWIILK
jgi:hypothetical protein